MQDIHRFKVVEQLFVPGPLLLLVVIRASLVAWRTLLCPLQAQLLIITANGVAYLLQEVLTGG